MLWYKGWLETRFRLLFVLGYFLFIVFGAGSKAQVSGSIKAVVALVSIQVPLAAAVICAMLAGAGIATQSPLRRAKGLHGSTLFTLSLPVSRLRLLAVRASLGWLEMAGAIGVLCCGMWFAFPDLKATAKAIEMLQYAGTVIACTSALYVLSVLASIFLDEMWQGLGTMIGAAGLSWLSGHTPLGASIDVLRAMGPGSPLIAHTMPWGAVAFSLGLSAILLLAALKAVETREY